MSIEDSAPPGDQRSVVPEALPGHPSWCDRIEDAPQSIAFAVLSILGGACGYPVSIWLADGPPDVVAGIQGMLWQHVPKGRVLEVLGQSEVRLLSEKPTDYSLVLIDAVRGSRSRGQAVQWLLSRRSEAPSPAVLLGPGGDFSDCPGPLLTLTISQREANAVRTWLLHHSGPDTTLRSCLESVAAVERLVDFNSLGGLVGLPSVPPLWKPHSLASYSKLKGLLAGRALLRRMLQGRGDEVVVHPILADYVDVYGLFDKVPATHPADPADPLLTAMVRRANFYMACTCRSRAMDLPGTGRSDPDEGRGSRASREAPIAETAITLRELADLGEPRSAMFNTLIGWLTAPGSSPRLDDIGWRTQPPPLRASGFGRERLATMLITWSPKQARTRFDALRREGLIDAVRDPPGNGPWVFLLPEAILGRPGEFEGLPNPLVLEREIRSLEPPA